MADTCPPALSAYHLKRAYGEDFAMPNVEKVIAYIKSVEKNDLNSIDHLGSNFESLFYPSSIWVDSLMMWVLISIQYGLDTDDPELLDLALPQPQIFTSRLTDPESGLLFHAWNIPENKIMPDGYSMEEISLATNPFSKWGYKLVPKSSDVLYGVGAFLLLAEELAHDEF